jgi:hypothetical protein
MLLSPRGGHSAEWLAVARDVIEIAAILAAGFWAFYIFVYENRIKPSLADPQVDFSASLQPAGVQRGLRAIRLDYTERNVGTVRARFLGSAITVVGRRVLESRVPLPPTTKDLRTQLNAFFTLSRPVPVFSYAQVFVHGDPASPSDDWLDPGSYADRQWIFYVPAGRFDVLSVVVDARYTKVDDRTLRTWIRLAHGIPSIEGNPDDPADTFFTTLTSLNLPH